MENETRSPEETYKEILAIIRHEMILPFSSIRGYTHLLTIHLSEHLDSERKDDYLEWLDKIKNAADKLEKTILELTDIIN